MYISLESLFGGSEESISLDGLSFDFSGETYNQTNPFVSPVTLNGRITNSAGVVSICATAHVTFVAPCDRCAKIVNKNYCVPVEHILVTSIQNEDIDNDYILVQNMKLDIRSLVLEDIYLFLPSKYLCKDDCKGLCPKCGANLNDTNCECVKDIDPRWEALLSFTDN